MQERSWGKCCVSKSSRMFHSCRAECQYWRTHKSREAWWRQQMETFSALLAICAGNSPVPVNSLHKGQRRGPLMFSLICVWINDWVNNRETGDLRRYRAHCDVTVMKWRKRPRCQQQRHWPICPRMLQSQYTKAIFLHSMCAQVRFGVQIATPLYSHTYELHFSVNSVFLETTDVSVWPP